MALRPEGRQWIPPDTQVFFVDIVWKKRGGEWPLSGRLDPWTRRATLSVGDGFVEKRGFRLRHAAPREPAPKMGHLLEEM